MCGPVIPAVATGDLLTSETRDAAASQRQERYIIQYKAVYIGKFWCVPLSLSACGLSVLVWKAALRLRGGAPF